MPIPDAEVWSALADLSVPPRMATQAVALLPEQAEGLIIYGSRARGDHLESSDLDLLAVVPEMRRGVTAGLVSMSCYTRAQLETATGTLFGAHLRRDSKVIFHHGNDLVGLLDSLGEVDTDRLLKRIRRFSCVLDAAPEDRARSLKGLVRQAKYLLRSALYGIAIRDGDPCFSLRELAQRHDDPSLVYALASRPPSEATESELDDLRTRLANVLGELPRNPHGSLDALIVNAWDSDPELVSIAVMARGHKSRSDPYEEITKVLL